MSTLTESQKHLLWRGITACLTQETLSTFGLALWDSLNAESKKQVRRAVEEKTLEHFLIRYPGAKGQPPEILIATLRTLYNPQALSPEPLADIFTILACGKMVGFLNKEECRG